MDNKRMCYLLSKYPGVGCRVEIRRNVIYYFYEDFAPDNLGIDRAKEDFKESINDGTIRRIDYIYKEDLDGLREGSLIKVHMINYTQLKEIKTRNYEKIFTVHNSIQGLCIHWTDKGFTPLRCFAWTVIFEDVNTGKLYHYNNAEEAIQELTRDNELRKTLA